MQAIPLETLHARLEHWRQELAIVESVLHAETGKPLRKQRFRLLYFLYRERVVASRVLAELQQLADAVSS